MENRVGFDDVKPKEGEGMMIVKAVFYLFLSGAKGAVSAFLTLIWLLVGLVFASNAIPSFASSRDTFLDFQILIFVILLAYETIVNFKEIKKNGSR